MLSSPMQMLLLVLVDVLQSLYMLEPNWPLVKIGDVCTKHVIALAQQVPQRVKGFGAADIVEDPG